ncbi:uncharacterized protein HKW66_Vig0145030 [Vigna angularis]|uniref:CTP synthase n=1 Tax=Phaseolus angularis TaxID=3914 RepID=A0A8T0KCL9_PHAAN|nr:uncharacterized protein HKW66_Vig0145030 [Vigna angularis]
MQQEWLWHKCGEKSLQRGFCSEKETHGEGLVELYKTWVLQHDAKKTRNWWQDRQCFAACGKDPYLNIDAGTMSPFEHAEVFVLDDSGEFVIEKERRGDYGRGEDPEAYKVAWNILKGVDGVLVPRGFGDGGVQGKILATKYAGEHSVPFLGICLGMQIVVNE